MRMMDGSDHRTDQLVTEQGLRELLAKAPELKHHLGAIAEQPSEGSHEQQQHHHRHYRHGTEDPSSVIYDHGTGENLHRPHARTTVSSSLLQSLAEVRHGEARSESDSTARALDGDSVHDGNQSGDSPRGGESLPLCRMMGGLQEHHHLHHFPFFVKNEEIDQNLSEDFSSSTRQQLSSASHHDGSSSSRVQPNTHLVGIPSHDGLEDQQNTGLSLGGHHARAAVALHQADISSPSTHSHLQHHQTSSSGFPHPSSSAHLMSPELHQHQEHHHLLHAAAHHEMDSSRHHLHYGGNNGLPNDVTTPECLTTQKAVAFLAGPRERIHVLGNPVEHCLRCLQEGLGTTVWRPHRHIGELKIRYICERHFDDLESNHHFDIPLCPLCNQVLYLYEFNSMLGVSNARRLHKYVLKCGNRHVLPLLDLFCQTKKGGEKCNANFKLQWCYGTMVKRCEAQKNRDHDLWWVRYKNEWKQRRTIIRYKKDFLSHLTDAQRSLLLGLGIEGEPPPDPKSALGPTFDAIVSNAAVSPIGTKIKKRAAGRLGTEDYSSADLGHSQKKRYRQQGDLQSDLYGSPSEAGGINQHHHRQSSPLSLRTDPPALGQTPDRHHVVPDHSISGVQHHVASDHQRREGSGGVLNDLMDPSLRHLVGAMGHSSRQSDDPATQSVGTEGGGLAGYHSAQQFTTADAAALFNIPAHLIVTGTPTPPLQHGVNGTSPVAVSCEGLIVQPPV